MTMRPVFSLQGATLRYAASLAPAVDDVTFEVLEGEFFGLLGRNGSGKSSIVRMMMGLITPSTGTVTCFGHDARLGRPSMLSHIGYMPQSAFAMNNLTVAESLTVVARMRGMTWKAAAAERDRVLEELQLQTLRARTPRRLSGGERRMLQLGAAVVGSPRALILDEPTNELDPGRRAFVWKYLSDLVRAGVSIVMVSHNTIEAEQVLQRVAIMRQGALVACGSTTELRRQVSSLVRVSFSADSETKSLEAWPLERRDGRIQGYLTHREFASFADSVDFTAIHDLSVTSATLEDVYHVYA